MLGVTFNNTHSYSDLGLLMKSDNRSLLPSMDRHDIKIEGHHGTWDFGNNTFNTRVITITFEYPSLSRIDLRVKMRKVAKWLDSRNQGILIFDDEPDKYYTAKIYNQVDLTELVNDGKFTVEFECQPLADLRYLASDVILDSYILLDHTDIRLGDQYSYTINHPSTIQINNFGTVEVRPIISITGYFSTFSISIAGKTLYYNQPISNTTLEINNEKYTVKKGNEKMLDVISGDLNTFLILPAGINDVIIGGTDLNCTVSFIFKPKYL